MALVGITAHLGLFRFGQLKTGETVYVPGGTGGVGSMVVQMAKAAGARVATSAGSPERVELCRRLGADLALNYKTDDIPARLREFAPEGVDVWYETQREPNLEVSIPLLRKHGRMILMAGRTAKPALPLGAFYPRNCAIFGFAMFNATPDEQQACAGDMHPLDRGRTAQAAGRPHLPAGRRRRGGAVPRSQHGGWRGHADRQSRDQRRMTVHRPIFPFRSDSNPFRALETDESAHHLRRLDDGRLSARRLGPRQDRRLLRSASREQIGERQPWWHPDFELVPCARSPTSTS